MTHIEPPDELLSAIYGTNGAEKVASIDNPNKAATLSDLALMFAIEVVGEDEGVEKVASAHAQFHQEFLAMDRAGRATAHAQISELEKMAEAGEAMPLLEFLYGDQVDENGNPVLDSLVEQPEEPADDTTPLQQAVLAEVARRLQSR